MKMLMIVEQHGIFGSNFACLFIFTLSSHWYAIWGDEALPSTILAGRGLLVKMLIILEPHHFDQILHTFTF